MKEKPKYRAHYGKGQPVGDEALVEVVFRNGAKASCNKAYNWQWTHGLGRGDIIAYRILEDV